MHHTCSPLERSDRRGLALATVRGARRTLTQRVLSALFACLAATPTLAQDAEWWTTHQPDVTMLGHTILAIDDADGDGVDDVIVTAPLAYTAGGRTGSVLVMSSASGKILRRLDGPARRERFGWKAAIVSRDASGRADAIALTDVACTVLSRWPYRLQEEYTTSLYSLPSLELRCQIDGDLQSLGSPGDIDGDGVLDILVDTYGEGWDCNANWYSTRDGRRVDHPAPPCSAVLIGEDYDQDGLEDWLVVDPDLDRRASVTSTRTGAILFAVQSPYQRMIPHRRAIAGPRVADGRRPILMDMSWPTDGTSEIVMYSGIDGRILDIRGVEPEPGRSGDGYRYSMHRISDIDADGCEDVITLSAYWSHPHVSAWSGRTMKRLWRVEGIIDIGSASFAAIRDTSVSEPRILLAIGGCGYLSRDIGMECFGPDGPITFLDAKTGVAVRSFGVENYPELTRPKRANGDASGGK